MAAEKSKALLIFGIFAGVIVLAVLAYYGFREDGWFRGAGCDPNRNGFDTKGNPNPKCMVANPAASNIPSPDGSGWISDSTFPIKKGSWGPKVKALQTKLGVGADGRFGPITETALNTKFKKTQIATQAEYDAIVNPKPAAVAGSGGQNFIDLKKALPSATVVGPDEISTVVTGTNTTFKFNFYSNGRVFVYKGAETGYALKGTYSNGGKRIKADGDLFAYTGDNVQEAMKSVVTDIE